MIAVDCGHRERSGRIEAFENPRIHMRITSSKSKYREVRLSWLMVQRGMHTNEVECPIAAGIATRWTGKAGIEAEPDFVTVHQRQ